MIKLFLGAANIGTVPFTGIIDWTPAYTTKEIIIAAAGTPIIRLLETLNFDLRAFKLLLYDFFLLFNPFIHLLVTI